MSNYKISGRLYGDSHGICGDRDLQHSILEVGIMSFMFVFVFF